MDDDGISTALEAVLGRATVSDIPTLGGLLGGVRRLETSFRLPMLTDASMPAREDAEFRVRKLGLAVGIRSAAVVSCFLVGDEAWRDSRAGAFVVEAVVPREGWRRPVPGGEGGCGRRGIARAGLEFEEFERWEARAVDVGERGKEEEVVVLMELMEFLEERKACGFSMTWDG